MWFTTYLSHQFQAFKIGSTLSELCELMYGVPQGSALGPLLFSVYSTPLSKVTGRHSDIEFHFHANDNQLFIHLSHQNVVLASENSCLQDVLDWMLSSILELNPDKTEFNVCGSHAKFVKLDSNLPVRILGNFMHPTIVVQNLGIWFDANFSIADHVCNICKTCFIQMHDLWHVRQYLADEAHRL